MEYEDEDIFKHSKTFGYCPDFKSEKFLRNRILKLYNKIDKSPIKERLLLDIAICRKEL